MSTIKVGAINSKTGNSALTVADDGTVTTSTDFALPSGTTAQRPSSPVTGSMRYNTDLGYVEYYDGDAAAWLGMSASGSLYASGGTITEITQGGTDYIVHTFSTVGTHTFNVLRGSGEVEYLVVAGGGEGESDGGNGANASGGGAGGYRCSVSGETSGGNSSAESPYAISVGDSITVTVGAGGTKPFVAFSAGENGEDSSFGTIVSTGGQGGNKGSTDQGGSGGGAGAYQSTNFGIGIDGQGSDGGSGAVNLESGGGGGAGADAVNRDAGDGLYSSITGTSVARGGGGAGHRWGVAAGTPGAGGGGSWPGGAGTANTGGGGGGGYTYGPQQGGAGGSGIVIVRYAV